MASDSADLLDVDLRSFVDHLRATKPPYECPYISCGKIYKSYNGIHSHLLTHGASPELFISGIGGETGEGSGAARDAGANSNAKYVQSSPSSREHLTYSQAQKFVDVEINGKTTRLSIVEPLEVITCLDDNLPPAKKSPVSPGRHKEVKPPGSPKGKPPEPSFRIVDDCPQPGKFELPKHYIRYIEKSSEEQNEDVEYDMDEEDHAWLKIMNDRRHARKHTKIDEDTFELVMDRLEKFCHFQNQDAGPFIDDDAVCCVCNDGECENSNVILFCDMCNLAVHQDCYGVPYIPEGEWLCRRCQLSPSKAVDCCLCPNKGGAFKQTSDGRWAHVVCGLWVPEVQFANVVFLEPMEGFERIPPARWKLSCFICKQRGVGACIQCHKPNCYTAFHVTCAQSAGLYMHMEPINDSSSNSTTVRKTICCDVHAPNAGSIVNSNGTNNYKRINELKEMSKKKLKKVRRMLIERRTVMPTVSIPVIPSQCLDSIEEEAKIPNGEKDFLQRIVAYWTLKRKARFGVPLLRRLQVYHHKKSLPEFENSDELRVQLKHFRRLRADLEKVRLLCELTRKREKRKQEQLDISFRLVDLRLRPFALMLVDVIDKIQAHDKHRVFAEPVSDATVAGYSKVITSPMDLGTMRTKALTLQYTKLEEVEADFTLMLQNCMKFNPKDTYHYRFAQSFRKWGHLYLNEARKILPSYDLESGLHAVDVPGVNLELSVCNVLSSLHFFDATKREDDMLSDELNFSGTFDHDEAEEEDKAITMEQLLAEAQMSSKQASAIERKLKKQAVPSSRKSKQSKQTLHSSSASASRTQPDQAALCLPSSSSANVGTPSTTQQRRRRGSVRGDVSAADQELPKKRLRKDGGCDRRFTLSESEDNMPLSAIATAAPKDLSSSLMLSQPPQSNGNEKLRRGGNSKRPTAASAKAKLQLSSPIGGPKKTPAKRPSGQKSLLDYYPVSKATKSDAGASSSRNVSLSPPPLSPAMAASKQPKSTRSSGGLSPLRAGTSSQGHAMSSPADNTDSFKQFRATDPRSPALKSDNEVQSADSEETESDGNTTADEALLDGLTASTSKPVVRRLGRRMKNSVASLSELPTECLLTLEPLDLVWAQIKSNLWYPGLLIDPNMPRTGLFQNEVAIPVPPLALLTAKNRNVEPGYPSLLVNLFDEKETWTWVSRCKLEPLGVDLKLDKSKLSCSSNAKEKALVRKAYAKAIEHRYQCKVTGESADSALPDSTTDNDTDADA